MFPRVAIEERTATTQTHTHRGERMSDANDLMSLVGLITAGTVDKLDALLEVGSVKYKVTAYRAGTIIRIDLKELRSEAP